MKYLARFLDPEISTDTGGEAPTEPTKPPRVFAPTPTLAADFAERWGPSVGDPTPGLDVEPPRRRVPLITNHALAAAIDAAWSPRPAAPRRWRCEYPYCYHKGGWWRSIHGAVFCAHCRPAIMPALVAERGDEFNAPIL